MSRNVADNNRELLDKQAARWVIKLNGGKLSRQQARFAAWLYQSAAHIEAFYRYARLWLTAENLDGRQYLGHNLIPQQRPTQTVIHINS